MSVGVAVRSWLELARLSNLPTCISNVLVGGAIAGGAAFVPMQPLILAMVVVCLLYAAGMMLNDVADTAVDRRERPQRPIPSGRIERSTALGVVIALMLAGVMLAAWISASTFAVAGVLLALIAAYDLLHKRYVWTVLLMGLCRGLCYVLGAVAVASETQRLDAAALGVAMGVLVLYTALITVIARAEHLPHPGRRRVLALVMPALPLLILMVRQPADLVLAAVCGLIMLAWLGKAAWHVLGTKPQTKQAVMTWLSGMCLVDAWLLGVLDRPGLAWLALLCFAVTWWGHRRIAGT